MAIKLFRIFYNTVFAVLFFVLTCLILLSPGDAIYQCYKNHNLTNIFIITGAYIITFLLGLLIYATRLYTNRSVLAGIPKAWIPVEKEDVGKSVRRLVVEGLARSAIVAYRARPRDLTVEKEDQPLDDRTLMVDRTHPPWGHISHPGWSAPSSPDLPDLHYQSVIKELPYLIEAKAVSLAPPDPILSSSRRYRDPYSPHSDEEPVPDPRVVEILQRPSSMGLREYIGHLTNLGLISPPELGAEFLAIYERARFSAYALEEEEFRALMAVFAEILRVMKSVTPQLLDEIRGGSSLSYGESIIGPSDEEGDTDSVYSHVGGERPTRGRSNSVRPSNASAWESNRSIYTAPLAQRRSSPTLSKGPAPDRRGLSAMRTPSMNSLRPVSLRRTRSNVSGSSGASVIRLVEARNPLDLPYTIDVPQRPQH
ncbi:thermatolerance membrane protein Dlt1 [Paecilomyces variotii No. 5]|uniref:Defect at low temperature protein 1 n=1 Tax=Byssochlamys spectabilis (strain No. 5 / NBRC 109023) TaxID=1356009 RepID=V5G4Y7_BYSSN|nr:thermatolerance membrane protein Dlt1 [Paecilomyces variotii No. 5]